MSVKDSINALVEPGKVNAGLPVRAEKSSIGRVVGVAVPVADDGGGIGLVSPIRMVITATTLRSIPVPAGATSVEVEDAAEYTLTDANGATYVVNSVTWP